MRPEDKIPAITPELLDYLERLYPDRAPSLKTEDRKVWYDAGAVQVVRHLRTVFDQQNKTVL